MTATTTTTASFDWSPIQRRKRTHLLALACMRHCLSPPLMSKMNASPSLRRRSGRAGRRDGAAGEEGAAAAATALPFMACCIEPTFAATTG